MNHARREKIQQRRARQAAFQQRRAASKNARQDSLTEEYQQLVKEDGRTVHSNYDNQTHQLKRKKKRRLGIFYGLLALVFVSIGLLVIGLLFFKVEYVRVEGNTRYPKNDILETTSVEKGSNLFTVNEGEIEKRLTEKYPYISSVELQRNWPETLIIKISEAQPAYALEASEGTGYILLSGSLKILETDVDNLEEGICLVFGLECLSPELGKTAQFEQSEGYKAFVSLISELTSQQYEKVTFLNLENPIDLSITYDNRLQIRLGSTVQLDYKLQYARYLIENEIDQKQKGILNMMSVASGKASFQPKTQIVDGEDGQIDEFYFPPEAENPMFHQLIPLILLMFLEKMRKEGNLKEMFGISRKKREKAT